MSLRAVFACAVLTTSVPLADGRLTLDERVERSEVAVAIHMDSVQTGDDELTSLMDRLIRDAVMISIRIDTERPDATFRREPSDEL